MGNGLGTPSADDKNQSRTPLQEHVSQADGGKLFQGVQALGKSGLCSGQLAGDCCKECWPLEWDPIMWSHENDQIM